MLLLAVSCVGCSGDDEAETEPASGGITIDCSDALDAVYLAEGSTPFTKDARGEIVGCAPFASYSEADVKARLAEVPGLVVKSGGVDVFLVAYRTAREPATVEGVSTALVYVPKKRMSNRVPLVLAAHGSTGVADACAPSRLLGDTSSAFPAWYFDALVLAWAARGLPVVAPDYAGLGTKGVHDYSNWFDPGRSAVDGLRALRSMLQPTELNGSVIVQGHSQGGGVALTAAALAAEAPDLDIRAVVATTPAWRTSTSLADAVGLGFVPLTPILRAAAAYALYSSLANLTADESQHGAGYKEDVRAPILKQITTRCFLESLSELDTPSAGYVPPKNVGELIDPVFVKEATDCTGGADCTTLGGRFVLRDKANEPHLPAKSPPVLVTASSGDEQATLAAVGCTVDRAEADGATVDYCIHSDFDHLDMVRQMDAYSIEWALAAAAGTQRPACTGTVERQACSLF